MGGVMNNLNPQTLQSIALISNILMWIFGIFLAVIFGLLKQSLKSEREQLSQKIDTAVTAITNFGVKFEEFQKDVLKNYVEKSELIRNSEAHEELWKEINKLRERVARVEPRGEGS